MAKSKHLQDNVQPLDGGWGWMIVIGLGIVTAICLGHAKSYSMIYQAMLIRFGESDFRTSIITSEIVGGVFLTGPIVGFLCNRYNHRVVVIAGSLLISTGMALSAYAPNLNILYASYGLLVGVGQGMAVTPSMTIPILYFSKKRGIAMALAMVSGSVGGVAMAPFIAWILQEYGFSGTLLICAGLFLNICIAGALFRPLKCNFPQSKINSASLGDPIAHSSVERNGGEDIILPLKRVEINSSNGSKQNIFGSFRDLQLQMTPHGSSADIVLDQKLCSTREQGHANNKSNTCMAKCQNVFLMLDISLLKNMTFAVFCLSVAALYISLNLSLMFLSGFALERSFSEEEITTLIIVLNVIDGLFKLVCGFLFDTLFVKKYIVEIYAVIGILQHIGLMIIIGVFNKIIFYILLVVLLGMNGVLHSQHSNILGNIIEPSRVTSAVGIMRFIAGVGVVAAPSIGGYLKDVTGLYQWIYLLAGSVGVLPFTALLLQQLFCKIGPPDEMNDYFDQVPQNEKLSE